MDREDTLKQAQQAILQEREKRVYKVVVALPRPSYGIAGVPMPKQLEAYVTETTCTVHKSPCLWVDWAFHINDKWHVVLESDLMHRRPGLVEMEKNVRELFAELLKEQEIGEVNQAILDMASTEMSDDGA